MSVLTYLYPKNLEPLAVESLLPAVRAKVEHVAIAELELRKAALPDWQSLTFIHPSEPEATFLFVVSRNTKDNRKELEELYAESPHLSVVRNARKCVWTQLKAPLNLPLKRLTQCWANHVELIAAVADVGNAVIDSPENEKLFTAASFRRHHRKHSQR